MNIYLWLKIKYDYLIEQINDINIIWLRFEMAPKDTRNMVVKDNCIIYSNEANLLQTKVQQLVS